MPKNGKRPHLRLLPDPVLREVAECELPGGQFWRPEDPPILPEPIGDVVFLEPGMPPANFLESAIADLELREQLNYQSEEKRKSI